MFLTSLHSPLTVIAAPIAVAISHANLRYTLMQMVTMAQAEGAAPKTVVSDLYDAEPIRT